MPGESYTDDRLDATLHELTSVFRKEFRCPQDDDVEWLLFTFAPGRVNFIGEHTDYMQGWVCPAAIQDGTHILVGRVKHFATENKPKLRFYATYNQEHFEMEQLGGSEHNKAWTTFIRGAVTLRLQHLGVDIGAEPLRGVCMVVHASIAMGAGMSASAAFGIALTHAINSCVTGDYQKAVTTPGRRYAIVPSLAHEELVDLAKQTRRIETDFCGVNVGIMDQFIATFAKENEFIYLDCLDLSYEHCSLVPLLGDTHCFMLIDSMIKHDLLGETANVYNAVRSDQENAEKKISEHLLGGKEFTFTSFVRNPTEFTPEGDGGKLMESAKPFLSAGEFERGSYQMMEQLRTLDFKRVTDGKTALTQAERLTQVGDILNSAHAGMKDLMKITTPELDYVQQVINEDPDVLGGRMMGGGFGGCIILLLKKSAQERVLKNVQTGFKARFGVENIAYNVEHCGSGAFVASLKNYADRGATQ